ncbi:NACHT domain-containing protein [Streptosporangiaceae bacterium NEAU-GS5]|nr:NACHT domain-containing protein [Streptosporangiaceae bacterium NEAU-GS5]
MLDRQRKKTRNTILLGLSVAFIALAGWMISADLAENDSRASVISLFVGLAALLVAVADYLRGRRQAPAGPRELAVDLAATVDEQWRDEAKARGLMDVGVLPLTWSATERDVSDNSAALMGNLGAGRVVRLRFDGRIEGGFAEATRQLAVEYQRVPSGRLVILGEPGAGKSVLAVLLTLGLLASDDRRPGAPVPTLLAASSWDPLSESMDEWVVQTLATSYYNGQRQIPQLLNDRGLVLPVIDGLDEIPESMRRSAVREISKAIGRERPVIITCRSVEYEDVISGGAPVLRRAPVIEVAPLSAQDVIAYLAEVDWPDGTEWEAVFAGLRSSPDSPVGTSLSTPLMVSMARRAYQGGGNPTELLDTTRFASRHAVEDELIDRMIQAAYHHPAHRRTNTRWDAGKAWNWLVFLARYMHQYRERDLAWWLLSQRLLSPWVAPGIGLAAGLIFLSIWVGVTIFGGEDLYFISSGLTSSVVYVVLAMVAWFVGASRAPGRLAFRSTGSWVRLRRGFSNGVRLAAFVFVPIMAILAFLTLSEPSRASFAVSTYWSDLMMLAGFGVVVGLALAAHSWLDAPPARSAQASPLAFLRQDRRSSLVGAIAAGGIMVLITPSALTLTGVVADLTRAVGTGWSGEPSIGELVGANQNVIDIDEALVWQLRALVGLGFAFLILLTRAWPRLVVARLILAAQGRLPLRLMRFLAHAREQELLRQSGGLYQFRHIRVQEWLATQPHFNTDRLHLARRKARRLRRVLLVISAVGAIIGWNFLMGLLPKDQSIATLAALGSVEFSPDGHTIAVNNNSTVTLWDWGSTTNRPHRRHTLPAGPDSTVTFSPDSSVLAIVNADSEGYDNSIYYISLWDTVTGQHGRDFIVHWHSYDNPPVAFSPDGRMLAVVNDETSYNFTRPMLNLTSVYSVRLWDTVTGFEIRLLHGPFYSVPDIAFSPDDDHTLIIGETDAFSSNVELWDTATGRERGWPVQGGGRVTSAAFTPDGRTVASVSWLSGSVWLWDAISEKPRLRLSFGAAPLYNVSFLTISPDGRRLVTVGYDKNWDPLLWLWDIPSGRPIRQLSPDDSKLDKVIEIAFSPDGSTFAIVKENSSNEADNSGVWLWNARNGRQIRRLAIPSGPIRGVSSVTFSPDGKTFATDALDYSQDPDRGDAEDIWLWDRSGQPRYRPNGHLGPIESLAFNGNGRALATASEDGTIRIWDPYLVMHK